MTLAEKIVETRKNHRCFGCYRTIQPGERALRTVTVDGGYCYSIYTCADCQWHLDHCEGCQDAWRDGDLAEGYGKDCDRRLDL